VALSFKLVFDIYDDRGHQVLCVDSTSTTSASVASTLFSLSAFSLPRYAISVRFTLFLGSSRQSYLFSSCYGAGLRVEVHEMV
jgi:hypothetical protein